MKMVDDIKCDVGYMFTIEEMPEWKAWLYAIIGYGIDYVRSTQCKLFGHKFVNDDYCSPDSGYMGATCKRCGYSFGSQLY